MRGLFHGALRVYLDRFLHIPPAPLPTHLDDEPIETRELLDKFLDTLNRQAQINEAGRIVARYLSLHHPVEPLIGALTYAVVREDADFHLLHGPARHCLGPLRQAAEVQVLDHAVAQYGQGSPSCT